MSGPLRGTAKLSIGVLIGVGCGRVGFDEARTGDGGSPGDSMMTDAGAIGPSCAPLPMTGNLVSVSSTGELVQAVNSASTNDTIVLAAGTYSPTSALTIITPGVTIRSASGNRADVSIVGAGSQSTIIYVRASNVVIADMTITGSSAYGVSVEPEAVTSISNTTIHNVRFVDNASAAVRVRPYLSQNTTGPYPDGGRVQCSDFVHTAPQQCGGDSVFGVRIEAARDWTVRANHFRGECSPDLTRAIWVNYGARDFAVLDNELVDNQYNIMVGVATGRTYPDALPTGCTGTPQAWGGIVCNNRISALGVSTSGGEEDFQEGIALWNACGTYVLHNTVVSPPGTETFTQLEYRFTDSFVTLQNNLLAQAALSRDGGRLHSASATTIYTSLAEFVDAANGDLRLAPGNTVSPGVDIAPAGPCLVDAAGRPRPVMAPTPGAYER